MNKKKRQEVFRQHVFDRLYQSSKDENKSCKSPSVSDNDVTKRKALPNEYSYDYNLDKKTEDEKMKTEMKQESLKDVKVYSVSLPPEGSCSLLKSWTETNQSANSESSSSSESEVEISKRKRKKKRKRGKHTLEATKDTTLADNDGCGLHDNNTEPSQETKSMTKNQRRKLRKKKRKQHQSQCKGHEFTFEPVVADERSRVKSQEEKCQELQEFFEAVWDVYITDVKRTINVNELQEKSSCFDTSMTVLKERNVNDDALDNLLQIKVGLTLHHLAAVQESIKSLECDVSVPEELRKMVFMLAEYWMKDVASSL
ncbi:transcriptional regulator ATRX homolog [Ptychodera flava]|uniref:transcriptional regulator ATRX homolog n=1 Tax=Ptychodera flava TaxID=63121 RepID=UPI003969CBC7